ncbi:MAG: hypothetical protein A2992_07985 [Elusimicrobia bacterium RIFCSPLOWO2_01_FULL_59_12]|nr:MAG: hypothetical protein A2992_07985 [Elusimicrobia bacterium RIFCSPLOWO2_01_FULL_59_12]
MRKHFFIGLIISAVCLYFAFRGLSPREIGHALQQANPGWLLVALAVYSGSFFLRVIRWSHLMRSVKSVPAGQLFAPLIIGFFANNLLPFRMGELIRAHVTGKKLGISRTAALGTVILERICDALSFLVIFLTVAFFFPFPEAIRRAAGVMGAGCILAIGFLGAASKFQSRTRELVSRLPLSPAVRDKVQHLLANFTHGVSGLTHGPALAWALPLSLGIWLIEGSMVYLIIRSFPVHISYPEAFFVLFFLGLSVTLPQAPGYVGTVELFGVTALSLLGIPKESGLPMILTIHGMQFGLIFTLGLISTWKEGMTLGSLFKNPVDNPPDR